MSLATLKETPLMGKERALHYWVSDMVMWSSLTSPLRRFTLRQTCGV